MPRRLLAFALLLIAPPLLGQVWQMETSGTTAGLRGVHAVGGGVVWASGTDGTVLRTEDSGYMWQTCAMPPGAEKLDFRAVWAWDANTAVVMSSGSGDLSRLYKTTDGCSHWTQVTYNPVKNGFWDALQFTDQTHGFILGDPVDGNFMLMRTTDGGSSWNRVFSPALAIGKSRSGAFAASNSALAFAGRVANSGDPEDLIYWFGSGGPDGAFVYSGASTCDSVAFQGKLSCRWRWDFTSSPVPLAGASDSSGVFSLAIRFQDEAVYRAIAVGGDYQKPGVREGTAAWTADGGKQWTASVTPPGGYRSAVGWDAEDKVWITVGPNGSDLSRNDGKSWEPIEHAPADVGKGGEWNALSLPWVVGPNGRIAKLNAEALPTASSKIRPPSGARARHTQ